MVPAFGTYYQSLCAVYSKRCVPSIEKQLARGNPKVDGFYESVRVKRVSYEKIKGVDPMLSSFFNVNTTKDLERVERIDHESVQSLSTEETHHGEVEKSEPKMKLSRKLSSIE